MVDRTRDAADEVIATIPHTGVVSGIAVDPIVGEVFVAALRVGHGVITDEVQTVAVMDIDRRESTDEIELADVLQGSDPALGPTHTPGCSTRLTARAARRSP